MAAATHKGLSTQVVTALLCSGVGPGSASLPASGHPRAPCGAPTLPPHSSGNCLKLQETATGRATLANGRAGFPAKPDTSPGGSKVNQGSLLWSGRTLPVTELCSSLHSPHRRTLALGCMKVWLSCLFACPKMLTE